MMLRTEMQVLTWGEEAQLQTTTFGAAPAGIQPHPGPLCASASQPHSLGGGGVLIDQDTA